MRWLGRISAADFVTLMSGLSGFLAITYILDGDHVTASLFIVLALVFDGLDGAVARRFGSSHEFGRFLDSIADSISFCFAPALLVYSNFYDASLGSAWISMPNAMAVITAMFIGAFGILRLARFSAKEYKRKYFLGFPTPAMALGAVVFCALFGHVALNPFSYGYYPYQTCLVMIALAFLMLSDVPFPKMKGKFLILSILVGAMIALPFLFVFIDPNTCTTCLRKLVTLALIPYLAYLVVGPFYVKFKRKKIKIIV